MFEPQNEIEPTIAANSVGISDLQRARAAAEVVAVLDPRDQRHRAAADAVEQRDHLRHRGHPHLQRRRDPDRGPEHEPERRSATACSTRRSTPGVSSVAITAIAIPTAAIWLPRTAVRGPVSPLMP